MTRLAGSHVSDYWVFLLTGPIFLHINNLARSARSTISRRDNQSMREGCYLGQRLRAKSQLSFSYKYRTLALPGGLPFSPVDRFSLWKGVCGREGLGITKSHNGSWYHFYCPPISNVLHLLNLEKLKQQTKKKKHVYPILGR